MRTVLLLLSIAACAPQTADVERPLKNGNCQWEDDECICIGSPILLDLDGDGYDLTAHTDGVPFALTPGSPSRRWSWVATGSDDAWLALPGLNRIVDDGGELFGDQTAQPDSLEPHGFLALARHDTNADSIIDASDAVYSQLRLWIDQSPRDGQSQRHELIDLESAGVHSISVDYHASEMVDEHGNQFRFYAAVDADAPVASIAYDVFLRSSSLGATTDLSTGEYEYEWTCRAWTYSVAHGTFEQPITTLPCNLTPVQGFPFYSVEPALTRQVFASKIEFGNETIHHPLPEDTQGIVRGLVGGCHTWRPFPFPDPMLNGGLGVGDSESIDGIRVKCTSRQIAVEPPSGGGCG
jgi:hypothetical protein